MFKLLVVAVVIVTVHAVEFEFQNHGADEIWVGILGNPGKGNLENGGFALAGGQSHTVQAADDWAGRIWPRTWCDRNTNHCLTGDCGNRLECQGSGGATPVSLAEITLGGAGGIDFYDISFVDGFNTVLSMEPIGGQGDGSQYSCQKSVCDFNLNNDCPNELKQVEGNLVVACKSACTAFGTDEYCCRGAHDRPETCRSSDWNIDYPAYFKSHCPDAYSYAYDDNKSTYTCHAPKYIITFG